MKLIKLDAIGSTNDFLKQLSGNEETENFTVVTAKNQTHGRGQMGSVWNTQKGKNLIMSILIKDFLIETHEIFNLNIIVSVAVIQVLENEKIPGLSIKWPNDIMSDNKKIGGILIENSIKSDGSILSVVGLGLNVNQTEFENLPRASSLALICNYSFNKDLLLVSIVEKIKYNIRVWQSESQSLVTTYSDLLFKKDVPMAFQGIDGNQFMGIIKGVSVYGKLIILHEDDGEREYDIKQIQMLY